MADSWFKDLKLILLYDGELHVFPSMDCHKVHKRTVSEFSQKSSAFFYEFFTVVLIFDGLPNRFFFFSQSLLELDWR